MARSLRPSHTPYVIMGRMCTGRDDGPPWIVGRRRDLAVAMRWVHDMTYAWLRLVGVHAPVLMWWVRDERDGTDHYLPTDRPKGSRNADQPEEGHTLF